MKYLILFLIRMYQLFLSPLLGTTCRFHPTCSKYAYAAYKKYGCFKGTFLTIKRLLKCHPWHPGGYDEV